VYYVAPNGSSGNSGTHSSPWSLSHAVSMAQPGWTIVFKDGRYTSSSRVLDLRGKNGTASKPIRFVSENRWGAVLDGQLKSSTPDVVRFNDSSHLILEGFDIKHGYLRGVRSDGPSNNITIRMNRIHHNANIDPCAVGSSATGAWGHGVLANTESFHWTLDSNLIHNNGKTPHTCSSISHSHDHGLYINGDRHTITNNILFGHNYGYNLKVGGSTKDTYSQSSSARSFIIINNTFVAKPGAPGQPHRSVTLYRNSGSLPRNVLLANNIFWGEGSASDNGIYVGGGGWPWPGTEVVNNVANIGHVFRDGRQDDLLVYKGNIDRSTNPGIFGTTLGMVSPKTENATKDDFRLTADAALLIDRGASSFPDQYGRGIPTEVTPMRDLVGTARPQGRGTDVGAHERMQ
jgi:hypothetical protein